MAFKGYLTIINVWGCSSIGRAPALQAGGRRFDPVQLHHTLFFLKGESELWLYQKVKLLDPEEA